MLGEGRPLAKRAWLLIFVKCTQWGKQVAALNVRARHAQQGPREVPVEPTVTLSRGLSLETPGMSGAGAEISPPIFFRV